MTSQPDAEVREHGLWFWIGAAVGWIVIGIGVVGMLSDSDLTAPRSFGLWFVGSAVVHDVAWLPVALAGGFLIGRIAPARLRAPITWVLGSAAVLVAIAMPFMLGYGRDKDVPSLLPRNYAAGLLVYLAVVVVVAALWVAASLIAERRRRATE